MWNLNGHAFNYPVRSIAIVLCRFLHYSLACRAFVNCRNQNTKENATPKMRCDSLIIKSQRKFAFEWNAIKYPHQMKRTDFCEKRNKAHFMAHFKHAWNPFIFSNFSSFILLFDKLKGYRILDALFRAKVFAPCHSLSSRKMSAREWRNRVK